MKIRTLNRNVAPLSLRAEVTKVDAEKRTVDLTWSTGARVLRNSWFDGPSYEELSMDPAHVRMGRLTSGAAPLLKQHRSDLDNVIGVVESARLENGKGIATVRFSSKPAAEEIFRDVKDGIVKNVSVGYRTYKAEHMNKAEKGATPIYRATDWEPYEVSAVGIGADPEAGFRSDDPKLFNECVFQTREGEVTVEKTEAEKQAEALLKRAAELKAQADEQAKRDADQATREADLAERERVSFIETSCRTAKLDETFSTKLIEGKVAIEGNKGVRAQILEAMANRSDETAPGPAGAVVIGEESREKWVRGAIHGYMQSRGLMAMMATTVLASKKSLDQKDAIKIPGVRAELSILNPDETGGQFRGMTLVDMARDFCEANNVDTRRKSPRQIVDAALSHRSGGGSQTISDFAVVLENVMYKVLLARYAQAADTWRRFCGTDSVVDFRSANRYRMGSFGVLPLKPEGAEYALAAIPDGFKLQISTQTYAQKIRISREAIINDDMGAITDQMGQFGRAAGLTIEKAVYDLLAQNTGLGPTITYNGSTHALFDAAFGNVGTGAALSMASLEADRVLMASQKDPNNNEFLDLRPQSMLVPLSIEGEANVINRAKFDPTAASAFERPNIVGGLFDDVIGTPRLTGTRRYMFVDPAIVSALKVVFLNGDQTPFMAEKLNWNVDDSEVKLRLDAKAMAFDPKGALTNAGA